MLINEDPMDPPEKEAASLRLGSPVWETRVRVRALNLRHQVSAETRRAPAAQDLAREIPPLTRAGNEETQASL